MKHFLIFASNIIIVIAIGFGVVQYANRQHRSSVAVSEQAFVNTAEVISSIADNYLLDTQMVCDGWAKNINANEMTMEEAIQYVKNTNTVKTISAHIIWRDTFQGMSTTQRISAPGDFSVDYSGRLRSIFSDVTPGIRVTITPRYNDPMTGDYVFSFCRRIYLLDEKGRKKEAVLLRVVPVSYLEERWVFPSTYTDADVALIKKDGEYILKPNSMKNESFFSYIYSYNRRVIDQKELAERVASEDFGYFYGNDASKRECIWVFCSLKKEDRWSVVVALPREEIKGVPTDWFIARSILFGLMLILFIDIGYFLFLIRGKKAVQDQLEEQAAELRVALTSERENKSIVQGIAREYNSLWIVKGNGMEPALVQDNSTNMEMVFNELIKRDSSYQLILKLYAGKYVYEEDKEEFLRACDYDNVVRQLRRQDVFIHSFRRFLYDKIEYYQVSYTATDIEGAFIVGFRDVDALMKEKQKQADDLAAALSEAERANRAKTVFLNNMSHDIRTPMNAIMGFTSLASRHIDNPELVQDYLSKISLSGDHLLLLINDVLDMSRIESGKVKMEEKEMNLPALFHNLSAIIQTNMAEKNLELSVDTMGVHHENIIADKLRLNQILLNIVGNAIKFTKAGGAISIRVIEHEDAPDGYASFEFRIKDTGIGMTEEFVQHIFESFSREETATVSGIQGTGLGMAITKNFVDMMGGTITVESEVNVGTEFTVCLSFRVSGRGEEAAVIPELQGMRALVVDHDYHVCESITNMLKEMGIHSQWSTTGEEAALQAKVATEQGRDFHIFILDWQLPDKNGVEMVHTIRQVAGDKDPVIVMTAYDREAWKEEAVEAGVTACCLKPVFPSGLRHALTAPAQDRAEAVGERKSDFAGKRLLLVEDNGLNQEIAAEILKNVGFIVDVAGDGEEALEIMRSDSAGLYDLILMDIQMPRMNGYECTRRIRELPDKYIANIPIIAMTANAFEEDKRLAMEAGMDGHIAKPVDVKKLLEVLGNMLCSGG